MCGIARVLKTDGGRVEKDELRQRISALSYPAGRSLKNKFSAGKLGSLKGNMALFAVLSTQVLAAQFVNQEIGAVE